MICPKAIRRVMGISAEYPIMAEKIRTVGGLIQGVQALKQPDWKRI